MRQSKTAAILLVILAITLITPTTPLNAQEDAESAEPRFSLPIEGGVKVPLSVFLSVLASDQLRLEAAAALPGFSAPLVDFEAQMTGRYYPEFDLTAGGIPMRPYIGGGGLFISSLGQAIPGIIALAGAEFVPSNIPLVIFFETSGTLPMTEGSTSIVFSFSIGARYSFAR